LKFFIAAADEFVLNINYRCLISFTFSDWAVCCENGCGFYYIFITCIFCCSVLFSNTWRCRRHDNLN